MLQTVQTLVYRKRSFLPVDIVSLSARFWCESRLRAEIVARCTTWPAKLSLSHCGWPEWSHRSFHGFCTSIAIHQLDVCLRPLKIRYPLRVLCFETLIVFTLRSKNIWGHFKLYPSANGDIGPDGCDEPFTTHRARGGPQASIGPPRQHRETRIGVVPVAAGSSLFRLSIRYIQSAYLVYFFLPSFYIDHQFAYAFLDDHPAGFLW